MKIYASFTLALLLTGSISMKAPPDTLWTKIFGGQTQGGCNNPGDVGRVVEITDDQGYVISGWTNSYGLEDTDVWIVNTDGQGNEIWSYTLTVTDDADEAVYDMKKTSDGGFILTGVTDIVYCAGGHGGRWACGGKVLLIRTNEFGDTLWTRRYDGGDMGWSWGNSVQETIDGGFVIVGRTDTEENGTDLWMSLTDKWGNQAWTRIYGHSGYDAGHSVRQTVDGGFIVTGLAQSDDTQKLWLIRTNELGDTLWTGKYLEGDWSEGKSVLQTDDGGFVVAGTVESWNNTAGAELLIPPYLKDYFPESTTEKEILLKKEGLPTLNESDPIDLFPGLPKDLKISSKTYQTIEHYQTVLQQDKIIEGRDAWLLRTNELGDKLWSEIIGGPGWDEIHSLSHTNEGGYIISGEKWVEGHDSQDIWLIRTDSNGDTLWTTTLGDSSREIAYDVKQTSDKGYIVSAMKHNREYGVDQTWLIRYGEEITGLVSPTDQIVTEFRLEQNYPNPFNPETIINYELPITNYVVLSIYNLLGQKVITLVSESQPAGRYQVHWNGTDQSGQPVSSGIYIYKLEAAKNVQMRKMMLIK
jgi:hypothetical protein